MQRPNDNQNQTTTQLQSTVALLSQRINQLERMLDGKELREAKVENGEVYDRATRLSLSNGMVNNAWNKTDVTGTPDATGKTKYMVYQVTDTAVAPPTVDFDWTRWV